MRNREVLHERAENMRMNPTIAERKFQNRLKEAGIYFKSQKVIGRYIVDLCIGGVIVEIDGRSHLEPLTAQRDRERASYLRGLGYIIIRVRNEDVPTFNIGTLRAKMKEASKRGRHNKKTIEIPDGKPFVRIDYIKPKNAVSVPKIDYTKVIRKPMGNISIPGMGKYRKGA